MRLYRYVPGVLLAALMVLLPAPSQAQSPDSASQAARDSSKPAAPAAGYGDSVSQQGVDTTRPSSAADSGAKARGDSLSPAPAPSAPADSILGSACSGARPGARAPGLLVVVFRTDAEASEQQGALKEAGGVAAGQSPDGGQYVRASSDSMSTRDVANLLALNPAVASVSERSCPAGR